MKNNVVAEKMVLQKNNVPPNGFYKKTIIIDHQTHLIQTKRNLFQEKKGRFKTSLNLKLSISLACSFFSQWFLSLNISSLATRRPKNHHHSTKGCSHTLFPQFLYEFSKLV